MRYIVGLVTGDNRLHWQHMVQFGQNEPVGITITIATGYSSPLKASNDLTKTLTENRVDWLRRTAGSSWLFNSSLFLSAFPEYTDESWLRGELLVNLDHDFKVESQALWSARETRSYHCQFVVTPEAVVEQTPKKLPLRIFISYRRNDSAGHTGRIYDRLRSEFGQDALFMDVDAIPLGANFVHVLREEVAKCDVFLAIIGPGWLDSRDDDGHRRLDNPTDFVRVEISTALQRNIPVIPILLDGTRMPKQQGLPPDLQSLPERNGLDVRHASFHADMDKLVRGVKDSKVSGPASASIATAKAFDADVAIAAKGRWVSEFHVDVESSQPPTVFKHYFMRVVLNGSFMEGFTTNAGAAPGAFIGPGTILVGDRWDGTTSPLWIVKHGHARLPTSKVCASFGQLTYLGPTWRPEFAALSDAVFKKLGGKPLERFITHP